MLQHGITYYVEVSIPMLWWQNRSNSVAMVAVLSTGHMVEMMVFSVELAGGLACTLGRRTIGNLYP